MDFSRPLTTVTPTLDGDVLSVLAAADTEYSGRQVHRLLGHSSEEGVRKALERLTVQGTVTSRRAGRAKLYQLNRQHLAAPYIEGLAGLRQELVTRLQNMIGAWRLEPAGAVLFGSVARGDAGPGSDIDLLVVRPLGCDPDADRWREQIAELEATASRWTASDARVLECGEEELREGPEPVVAQALRDGIPLAGSRLRLQRLAKGRAG